MWRWINPHNHGDSLANDSYFPEDRMQPGDKDVLPDDVCDRFEIDPPPKMPPL